MPLSLTTSQKGMALATVAMQALSEPASLFVRRPCSAGGPGDETVQGRASVDPDVQIAICVWRRNGTT